MKSFKKPLAVALALSLTMGLGSTALAVGGGNGGLTETAGQYTYTAPTYAVSVDDNIVTASAHRAASPVLGMMGVDAVCGFGMVQGSAPKTLAAAQQAPAVGIWGSDVNDNPDPYYWNYFYNFYAAETEGAVQTEDALVNANVAASPVQADTNLVAEYGNVSYSLSKRPEILIGCSSKASGTDTNGYDDQLATIHSFTKDSPYYQEGDETYSPELVSYQTTRIKEMISSVYTLADSIEKVEKATGETTRYGSVQNIANDYEGYVYGTIGYIQSKIASGAIKQKTVAVLTSYDAATNTYTLANSTSVASTSTNRPYEYVMNVADAASIGETYGTAAEKTTTGQGGKATTSTVYTVPAEALKHADAIVVIQGSIENAQDGTTAITRQSILESLGGSYDGIICAEIPAALYGMTMNSVENANGYGYIDAYIYSDVLPELNPVEMTAYFYQRFYHISDTAALQQTIINNFEDVTLPTGCTTTLASTYSAATIEKMLNTGITYARSQSAAYAKDETASIVGLDSIKCTKMSGDVSKAVTKTTSTDPVVLTVYTKASSASTAVHAKSYTAAQLKALEETTPATYAYSGKSGAKTVVATEYVPFAALLTDAGVTFEKGDTVNFTCTDGVYTKFIPTYDEITAATLGSDGAAATPALALAYGDTAATATTCTYPKFMMALTADQYENGTTLMGKCFATDIVSITITYAPFTDVSNQWYAAAVKYAYTNNITSGTSATTFGPNGTLKWNEMITFMYAAAGSPNGKAAAGENWWAKAQAWAISEGYITASQDMTASINRLDVVKMLYAKAGSPAVTGTSPFTDCSEAAAVWAYEKGLTAGVGNNLFAPTTTLNRATAVTFIYAAFGK